MNPATAETNGPQRNQKDHPLQSDDYKVSSTGSSWATCWHNMNVLEVRGAVAFGPMGFDGLAGAANRVNDIIEPEVLGSL